MSTNSRNTLEEFDSILRKVESLSNPFDRLEYLKKIKHQYAEIFEPKRRIKLLSNASEKIIDEFVVRFNRLFEETKRRLKNVNSKKEDEIRKIDSYFQWKGTSAQLRLLLKELIAAEFIYDNEKNIDKIIDNHFYIEDYSENKDEKINRIKWNAFIPDFIHLFEKLSKRDFLDRLLLKRHHNIAPHFIDRFNNNMTPEKLRKEYSKYRKKKDYIGDRFWEINEILKISLEI